jgi:tripartite-type tricarboxylate transporter receptor subunit TctC
MSLSRRRMLQFSTAAAGSAALAFPAVAQSYPNRPVKFILAEAAGSSNDVVARLIAPPISAILGQSIIVENRPGGGTLVGLRAVVESPPDGYTLLVSSSSALITTKLLNANDPFSLAKDLTPIAGIASTSWVLVTNPHVPVKSVQELVNYAQANPGRLNIGFAQGTGPQLVAESFKTLAGVDVVGVPYTGGGQVVTDLLGGNVQLYFGSAATTLSFVQSGALRGLVVTGETRDPLLPNLPTMKEAGFPKLTLASALGIFGPAHLPEPVVNRIYSSAVQGLNSSLVAEQISKVGYTLDVSPPHDYAGLLARYQAIWTPIARAAKGPPR